jgi:thiosulfate/3-mercaptopyruvate sulfurtransferase
MTKTIVLLFISFFSVSATAQKVDHPILISSEWLQGHLKDPNLILIQVTFLKLDYDREHIEGARYLWPEQLAPNSPEGSYNAPDIRKATEILQNFGVNDDSHIVLYHIRNEVSPTARIFLTLENLGLKGKVSFLNGGLDEWKKKGYPVTTAVPKVRTGNVRLVQGHLLVDRNYVLETLQSGKGVVVDARMKNYYDGDPTGNPRDGHITGAKNIPYTDMIDEANKIKPLQELGNYFNPLVSSEKEIVTYCFIGQTASVIYMAGRLLGYNVKLYDGSMQEWSRIESLPMEKTIK